MRICVLFPSSFLGTVRNRVIRPFVACGHEVCSYNDHRELHGSFDIVFVHSMYPREIVRPLPSKHIIPFDAADGTSFNQRSDGYYSVLVQCQFYAKMNYDTAAKYNDDKLKLIAIPSDADAYRG